MSHPRKLKKNYSHVGFEVFTAVVLKSIFNYSHVVCHVSTARLVSCLVYSSALMMEAVCSSKTSVDFTELHSIISQKTELLP
jgi:hypothetical protein